MVTDKCSDKSFRLNLAASSADTMVDPVVLFLRLPVHGLVPHLLTLAYLLPRSRRGRFLPGCFSKIWQDVRKPKGTDFRANRNASIVEC